MDCFTVLKTKFYPKIELMIQALVPGSSVSHIVVVQVRGLGVWLVVTSIPWAYCLCLKLESGCSMFNRNVDTYRCHYRRPQFESSSWWKSLKLCKCRTPGVLTWSFIVNLRSCLVRKIDSWHFILISLLLLLTGQANLELLFWVNTLLFWHVPLRLILCLFGDVWCRILGVLLWQLCS